MVEKQCLSWCDFSMTLSLWCSFGFWAYLTKFVIYFHAVTKEPEYCTLYTIHCVLLLFLFDIISFSPSSFLMFNTFLKNLYYETNCRKKSYIKKWLDFLCVPQLLRSQLLARVLYFPDIERGQARDNSRIFLWCPFLHCDHSLNISTYSLKYYSPPSNALM
jgi:hypothetical protein